MSNYLGVEIDNLPVIGQVAATTFCQNMVDTSITTVGAGTLTAAAIVGGVINRSGPTGAFNDTTDTAQNILAAVGLISVGQGFLFTINNTSSYTQTLVAGTGVTLTGNTTLATVKSGTFQVICTSITNPVTVTI